LTLIGYRFSSSVGQNRAILDLLYASPVWQIAQLLLGRDRIHRPGGAQIALRHPQMGEAPPSLSNDSWHIGMSHEISEANNDRRSL